MLFRLRLAGPMFCVGTLLLVGCDGSDTTDPLQPQVLELSIEEAGVVTSSTYYCRLVRTSEQGSSTTQIRPLPLERLGIAPAPDGERLTYRYRTTDEAGRTTSLLQCEIPATASAVATLHSVLGVEPTLTLQSCVEDGVCDHDPIVVTVPGGDDCDPYQELDFSCDDGTCMESLGTREGDYNLYGCEGPGGGGTGGDGDGGGGGGGTSGGDNDTDLIGDEDATLSMEPPDCSKANLKIGEEAYCEGDPLSEAEQTALREHAENIIARCDFLSDDYSRAKLNIRKYDKTQWGDGKGGWAPPHGDWIALSTQRIAEDFEMVLVHELLHLEGHSHADGPDSQQWKDYKSLEEKCSGGRSSLW